MQSSSLICLCAFVVSVLGKSRFTQPPANGPDGNYQDNPVYALGKQVDVQWQSDLDTMDLILFEQYPAAGKGVQYLKKLRQGSRSTSLIWTVSLDGLSRNVTKGEDVVLYFAVLRAGTPNKDAMSHYFNVTLPDTTTSATGTPTASTMVMTTSSMTNVPTNTPTGTTTTEPESSGASSGLSNGAVAGIAVGCTLGGILVLGGIGLLAWKKFRKGKGESSDDVQASEVKPPELAAPPAPPVYEAPATPLQSRQPAAPIYEAP
ncbi:hypothetical protein VFPPC_11659 [Pochonia chlamydosporia 170]|uniref:Uncharacterized protein n=1 Tax=Pochonia chlamydosporia 170 TaxID=1380566 RepID=A0A179EYQ8_METCM|nr:hypothetical protein VFPPC_11659 [Pochonia chlamydosporia 170]OAQ58324.1 hypothetical protein VFPPC_11659 [Pochonia chlamydosporia 170]